MSIRLLPYYIKRIADDLPLAYYVHGLINLCRILLHLNFGVILLRLRLLILYFVIYQTDFIFKSKDFNLKI